MPGALYPRPTYFVLSSFTWRCFPNTNDLAPVYQRAQPADAQAYNVTQTWLRRVVQNYLFLVASQFGRFDVKEGTLDAHSLGH
jgi:hypothetical protein